MTGDATLYSAAAASGKYCCWASFDMVYPAVVGRAAEGGVDVDAARAPGPSSSTAIGALSLHGRLTRCAPA